MEFCRLQPKKKDRNRNVKLKLYSFGKILFENFLPVMFTMKCLSLLLQNTPLISLTVFVFRDSFFRILCYTPFGLDPLFLLYMLLYFRLYITLQKKESGSFTPASISIYFQSEL